MDKNDAYLPRVFMLLPSAVSNHCFGRRDALRARDVETKTFFFQSTIYPKECRLYFEAITSSLIQEGGCSTHFPVLHRYSSKILWGVGQATSCGCTPSALRMSSVPVVQTQISPTPDEY